MPDLQGAELQLGEVDRMRQAALVKAQLEEAKALTPARDPVTKLFKAALGYLAEKKRLGPHQAVQAARGEMAKARVVPANRAGAVAFPPGRQKMRTS